MRTVTVVGLQHVMKYECKNFHTFPGETTASNEHSTSYMFIILWPFLTEKRI